MAGLRGAEPRRDRFFAEGKELMLEGTMLKERERRTGGALCLRDLKRDKLLYVMLVPGLVFFLLFKYLPMAGIAISFMDYLPFLGILKSPWAGLKHFVRFFFRANVPPAFREHDHSRVLQSRLLFPRFP